MKIPNVFAEIPPSLPEELTETLVDGDAVRIERIVSRGHCSPAGFWYEQPRDEWVIVLSGAAEISYHDGRENVRLEAGDYVSLPAGLRHRVEWTEPDRDTVWLAVHHS